MCDSVGASGNLPPIGWGCADGGFPLVNGFGFMNLRLPYRSEN
jgi:hypothetical protein